MENNTELLHRIDEKLGKMYTKVMGDKELQIKGMVDEIQDIKTVQDQHGKDIQGIKDRHFKQTVTVGAAGAAAGTIAGAAGKGWLLKILGALGVIKL